MLSDTGQSTFYQQAENLAPEQYTQFKRAIETGKWANGANVSSEQRELMLQAVIVYEHANPKDTTQTGRMEDNCAREPDSERTNSYESASKKSLQDIPTHFIASTQEH